VTGLDAASGRAGDAFAAIVAPLFDRIAELEHRVDDLDTPAWMTIEEAAEHVRSTPAALRARARRGQLPGAVRDGSRWIVDRRRLDAALNAKVVDDNRDGRAPRKRPRPGTGGISSHA
jgi:hypothetical protein